MLGIDIGTAAIKVVEISSWGKEKKLKNYGLVKSRAVLKEPFLGTKTDRNVISSDVASGAIKEILKEAKIETKLAVFSIPDFSTFCTSFEIPPMSQQEIAGAVRYNASQYITLPISEVSLDWRIISSPIPEGSSMKVFVVAIPNEVIKEYQAIAKGAGLKLRALEAEVFGIMRALVKDVAKTVCIIDVGMQTSTLNIIDRGLLKKSYSFNFSSNQLTEAISSVLQLNYDQAEDVKRKEGLLSQKQEVKEILYPLIDPFLSELKNISAEFLQSEGKQIEEIYLTGGGALMPGFKEYVAKAIERPVSIPNCFSGISYPPILQEALYKLSPSFSAAVGVALDGLNM